MLIDIHYDWIVPIKKLITSDKVGAWCQLQYPGHKKGCPKYGKSKGCPPQAPKVNDYFDVNKPLYFVHSEFDLTAHIEKMKIKLPKWSERQCKCVLYWQPTSRKQMHERVEYACKMLKTDRIATCPEAMGVNVFLTARRSGLILDKTNNIKICRHIALIGYSC